MSHAYDRFLPAGMTWRDLFDMVGGMRSQEGRRRASVLWVCCSAAPRRGPNPKVIVMARKPDFFSYNMSLYEVVTEDGLMKPVLSAKRGGLYCGGR